MASVFLSYGHPDRERAKAVAEALGRAGHEVWWDRQIKGGSQFSKEIEAALDRADAIVVLWSANSVDSTWVRDEAAVGRDTGRLVPARIDASPPPLGFRQFHTIDLLSPRLSARSIAMTELVDAIGNLQPRQPGATPELSNDWETEQKGIAAEARFTRRKLALGVFAGAAVLAAGAAGYSLLGSGQAQPPPQVAAILAQAWQSWTQGTVEGQNQAIGLYRRVTEIAPEFADGWGFLGCAYADKAHYAGGEERGALRARATEAGNRALEIDAQNAYGRLALAYARPIPGNWMLMEREFRKVAEEFPDNWLAVYSLGLHLTRVGRNRDAADWFDKVRNIGPTVYQYFLHTHALWAAGRPDQAERLLNEATTIFSTHPLIWLARFQMRLFGGNPSGALAMTQTRDNLPAELSEIVLSQSQRAAQAAVNRDPREIGDVMESQTRLTRQSSPDAESAIEFACLFGKIDTAFEIGRALFLSDGYAIPDSPNSTDVTLESRNTRLLFLATTQPMRADPRFETLVNDIGLARYWRESGSMPDYKT